MPELLPALEEAMSSHEPIHLIHRAAPLGNGYEIAEAIAPDGSWSAWLLAPPCAPRCAPCEAQAERDAAVTPWPPPHEGLGPLPARFLPVSEPHRCGRPRRDGRPCRTVVSEDGDACRHHG